MIESDVFSSNMFHTTATIVDDTEEDNPCEDEIRDALDKVLDEDIDDADEDWDQDENEPPNMENNSGNHGNHNSGNHSNQPTNYNHSNKEAGHQNDPHYRYSNISSKNAYDSHVNTAQNNLIKHAFPHNGGQWPHPQPPQPLHPYQLKVPPYPYQGPFPGHYSYNPYHGGFPGPGPGFESNGTYDSRDSSEATGNNTEQLSRDDYYPVGADKSDWNSGSPEGGSMKIDSDVFNDGSGDVQQPARVEQLYRANQRRLEEITSQLQNTKDTYTNQIHSLQHDVGLLKTEKEILESQLSQSAVREKELQESAERQKYDNEGKGAEIKGLNEEVITLQLQLQEKNSEIDRMSYQLKDTTSKKETEYYAEMLKKTKINYDQQLIENKKKLDNYKREAIQKDLEIEKLKVELQNSVNNKMTSLEADLRDKADKLKSGLEELLITLPKMNLVDINLPLVTEIHCSSLTDLTTHLSVMTERLCGSEEHPRVLVSRIEDLSEECGVLRHTAAQLQDRVVTSERSEQEAKNTADSKERAISYLQTESGRLQERLKELHSASNESELRADQAIAREREAMEKLAEAERRCEHTLKDQTNTLKRMRGIEETSRIEKHGLENKIEEHRLQVSALRQEVDKNKELYVNLSKEKENLKSECDKRIENFQQKASDELRGQLREIKSQCDKETEQLIIQKEEDMLHSFEEDREQLRNQVHSQLTQDFEKRLQLEIENSQKQWSGSTNVSTLCILEMTHRGCQTEKVMDSLHDSHYAKIWQKERESELSLARETAVALARAGWEMESEKTVRNRVDIIVKSKKDEWSREAYRANVKEVDSLKSQLKDAVSKTEDMRRKIELEYKHSLSKANEEYKTEMNRLLKTERDKSSKCERRLNMVQSELERCKEDITTLRNEKSAFMQDELKQKMELDKLSVMFDQLKSSEQDLKDRSGKATREVERLRKKIEQYSQREHATSTQCEAVITQMKEELLGYAENANRQAMEFVQRAVTQCKETTAAKYKKYYQRLLYCLIEKHPTVKGTVKHLQLTLPKQVPRTPLTSTSPHSKAVNLDLLTQTSNDSGLPSTQSPTRLLRSPTCSRFNCSEDPQLEVSPASTVRRKLHLKR